MVRSGGVTPRKAMTPARKRRLHELRGGRCPCGVEVPVSGPGVCFDHTVQLAFDGPEEDSNIFPICDACRRKKDASDARARGKVRRIRKKAARMAQERPDAVSATMGHPDPQIAATGQNSRRHGPEFRSRPFPKGKRKFPSRPFPKRGV